MTVLDLPGLAGYLGEHHTRDLFRLETLDRYVSASDGDQFDRFLRGDPDPDRTSKAGWLAKLRDDTAAGRRWRRVHIIDGPLSDYVRYECEWGYTDNTAAGEQVRILDLATAPTGTEALRRIGDFYLVDGAYAATMDYDDDGRFRGSTPIVAPVVVDSLHATAIAAWKLATPFPSWWAANPQHHRRRAA